MFVVDKVVDEDRKDELTSADKIEAVLPNGATTRLGPSSHDAYAVFEDLCLLANSEHPRFLKLESLRKTFALELIESVLTNYHDLFRKVGCARLFPNVCMSKYYIACRATAPAPASFVSPCTQVSLRSP